MQLCEEMDAEYTHLWYRELTELSKGRSLARVFEWQRLIQKLLLEKQSPLAAHFSDTEWVAKLAPLCDIFTLLKKLILSLQGRATTEFKLADKVAAFKAKLELWGWWVSIGIFDMFQTLAENFWKRLSQGPLSPSWCMITYHSIPKNWSFTFQPQQTPELGSNVSVNHSWMSNGESTLSVLEEDQLCEIANDSGLKSMFKTTSNLQTFWIKVKVEYLETATKALKTCFHFQRSVFLNLEKGMATHSSILAWRIPGIEEPDGL